MDATVSTQPYSSPPLQNGQETMISRHDLLLLCALIYLRTVSGRRKNELIHANRSLIDRFPEEGIPSSRQATKDYFDFLHVSSTTVTDLDSEYDQHMIAQSPSAWPPWPFNLLSSKSHQSTRPSSSSTKSPSLIIPFIQASTRAAILQTKSVASQLWLHAPPAAPPFVLLALIPYRQQVVSTAAGGSSSTLVIPLFHNPFVRSLAIGGAGLAVMSWAHVQLLRKRLLTPLPIPYNDLNRAILPPFLPENDGISATSNEHDFSNLKPVDENSGADGEQHSQLPKSLRKLLAKRPGGITLADWRRMRRDRWLERRNQRRQTIMEQCMALQKLKQNQRNGRKKWRLPSSHDESSLGYALVTGASKGLGRAIAVELARWGFPLILLARDIDRLTALAYDLEACYGVKCCVLQADLAKHGEAERVHQATKKAGLKVDILVNNAGINSHGDSVDLSLTTIQSMIQLNVMTASILTQLYGKDMKDRRRGRILMVSSICGAVAGIPSVAVYAATKAYEKTLSISIAKELEKYGVGVTCLLPGAISDTNFRGNSNAHDALCWNIPFYPRPPHEVASAGVRAMLRGDTEVMPGWMNRAFIKVMMPVFPQRLHNWVAEIMWNPLQLPFMPMRSQEDAVGLETLGIADPASIPRPHFKFQSPPRLLELEPPARDQQAVKEEETSHDDERVVPDEESLTEQSGSIKDDAVIVPEGPMIDRVDPHPQGVRI